MISKTIWFEYLIKLKAQKLKKTTPHRKRLFKEMNDINFLMIVHNFIKSHFYSIKLIDHKNRKRLNSIKFKFQYQTLLFCICQTQNDWGDVVFLEFCLYVKPKNILFFVLNPLKI